MNNKLPFCPKCMGWGSSMTAKFCPGCGSKLFLKAWDDLETVEKSEKSSTRKNRDILHKLTKISHVVSVLE